MMSQESERVTVRLPKETANALHGMVDGNEFNTISEVLRTAIDEFIEARSSPEYVTKMTVELPKGNVVGLDELVQQGDAISIDDAIRNAVRDYVRMRLTKKVQEQTDE